MVATVKLSTKILGVGRQYEILHNVDCNFTQNVTYTVLIRDQQRKECQ